MSTLKNLDKVFHQEMFQVQRMTAAEINNVHNLRIMETNHPKVALDTIKNWENDLKMFVV